MDEKLSIHIVRDLSRKPRVEKDRLLAALHQKHKAVATRGEVKRLEELLTFPHSKEGLSNSISDDKVYRQSVPLLMFYVSVITTDRERN